MATSPEDRRRSIRLPVQITALLRGTDAAGRSFFDRTEIVSIDDRGARVHTRFVLRENAEVVLELPTEGESKRMRVVWTGDSGGIYEGVMGLEFADPNDSWNLESLRARLGVRNF